MKKKRMNKKMMEEYYLAPKRANLFVVLLYLILGIYFINFTFGFVNIPESFLIYEKWVVFAGGILMLFGAVNYFRAKSN